MDAIASCNVLFLFYGGGGVNNVSYKFILIDIHMSVLNIAVELIMRMLKWKNYVDI